MYEIAHRLLVAETTPAAGARAAIPHKQQVDQPINHHGYNQVDYYPLPNRPFAISS